MNKRIVAAIIVMLMILLTGCGEKEQTEEKAALLSFSDSVSVERMQELDGKQVTIIGYMATLSPISGKFMYLMNMPYQSCPFCLPNTNQLTNTMAVYAPEGDTFEFTDQAIQVTGTLVNDEVVDEFGYSYNYRIKDARYEVVDLSTVSEEFVLWQAIATDGVINEIFDMFDYLYFLSHWTEYQGSYTDDDGNVVDFYMYPGDVYYYLQDDSAYGYADKYSDDYFTNLIARIRAISPDGLEDLVAIIEAADALTDVVLQELYNENYTYDEAADKYTLNNAEALDNQFYEIYYQFFDWLARWEL